MRDVVSPVHITSKFIDRHQLNAIHSQFLQMFEIGNACVEVRRHRFARERPKRADVHLVNDDFIPVRSDESGRLKLVGGGIVDQRISHGIRQTTSPRIPFPEHLRPIANHELVSRPDAHIRDIERPPSTGFRDQKMTGRIEAVERACDRDTVRIRSQGPKSHSVSIGIIKERRAESRSR